ncbi:MAG TPA: SDR family NAD(P)-dependent oxidoreductase [Zeimonas sp.]
MPRALILGASRGLGLEFAKQYAADGWTVLATHRAPADAERLREIGVQPLALDVLDPGAPTALAAALAAVSGDARTATQAEAVSDEAARAGALDLAIVNAGIHGPRQVRIDHPPSVTDFDAVMHTNVLGPMRLLAVLARPLEATKGTLALVTSRMGSVSAASTPNSLLYRVSKAAENMLAKAAHVELSPCGVRVLALHPGWVRTDMGGPNAEVGLEESVRGMRRVLADALSYPGGCFFDYKGEALAW